MSAYGFLKESVINTNDWSDVLTGAYADHFTV